MLKHTIVALLCWFLPALAFGASFQAAQPANLELPIGVQVNSSDHKIVGGANAPDGEFPYQVSLRSPSNSHFCGGSIISPAWILTAAHCVPNLSPSSVIIVAGTNTLNSGGIAYGVAQIVSHSSYNPQNNANDIALLRVNGQIAYTDKVKPIQLALLSPLPGATLVLSGWGLTSYPGQQLPNQLQYIGLQSIGILNCQQQLPGYPISTVGNICSSAPVGQGACQGDSGGPLVTQAGVQVGIVSWGIPCAKGMPDIFISVAAYRLWILTITGVLL